jgi:3-oxoacyl-[acyl-carrier-protein] synthase II
MRPWVTRMEAVSAAGAGVEALAAAITRGHPLRSAVPWDTPGLKSPFAALAHGGSAEELLIRVVEAVAPPEGAALIVATSSGAISGDFERWHAEARASGAPLDVAGWRQGPTARVAARIGAHDHATISVACASGTSAFEIARGWLRAGLAERVIVAGVDALSLYIHAGFAGLGALSATGGRAFAADRDGLMLGEGAAAFLVETPASARAAGRAPLCAIYGCGLSQDGVHLTAPDRTGAGLARAANAALRDAGLAHGDIGTVSAHGTSTAFNDAMEARALAAVFGGPVPLHAAKPVIGHTLGAAGALEAAALIAYLNGAEPPPPIVVTADDCPIVMAPCVSPRFGLSVSAAFGGVDAAVVFGPATDEPVTPLETGGSPFASGPSARAVRRGRTASIATDELPLAKVFPGAPPALGRADAYTRAGIAALAALRDDLTPDTAVVLASASNCHAADLRYHQGLLDGGPPQASRMHFSYTVPGAPVAEASILLGLRGPVHVFCDDGARAHVEARRLVAEGAPRAVALVVEAPGGWADATATVYEGYEEP